MNYCECQICKTDGFYQLENYKIDTHPNIKALLKIEHNFVPPISLFVIKEIEGEKPEVLFYTGFSHCPGCGKLMTTQDLDMFWGRIPPDEVNRRLLLAWNIHQLEKKEIEDRNKYREERDWSGFKMENWPND